VQRLLFVMRRAATGAALLALASWPAARANAQGTLRPVTGRVIDGEDKAPIPAASVQVVGTTLGTTTTDSGTFSVRVPQGAATLTIRRIGFRAVTVIVAADQGDVAVSLARDILELQQQVVTGVATSVASENAANDVAVVTSANLNRAPAPTVENALQGKVPGAVIQQNNGGDPGGGMQVQIRGITSLFANAYPLYVVDGVIVNNETVNSGLNTITQSNGGAGSNSQDLSPNRIADLNPEDIETIEVLKGASASAIYGSKASAGVIIITTKKGKAGKPRIELSQKVGQFDISNTYGLRTFPTLASAVAWGNEFGYNPATIKAEYGGPQNYQSQLFGNNQLSYETDASISGISNNTQYFVSGLAKYDNGTMTNTGYNKQTVRANLTQTLASNLTATADLNFAHSETRRGVSGNDNIGVSPYDVFSYTPQFVSLDRQVNGAWPINPFGPANPFADAAEIQTPETVNRFIGGGNIDWEPLKLPDQTLHITFIGGADYTTQNDLFYAPPDLQVEQEISSGLPGVAQDQYGMTTYLNYSINLVHHFTGLKWLDATTSAGFVREKRSLDNPLEAGQNILAGAVNPTLGAVQTLTYNATAAKDQSLYAQEQVLLLQQRLALTAGVTAERTTNDGDINKFFPYPHFSGSYRVPQFASWLDELKLRAAYGQSGTQPNYGIKYTPFNTTVSGGLGGYYGALSLGDSTIRPEQEAEIETGFDATFLKSRAQFSFTVYQKRITDLLLQNQPSPSLGFDQSWFNGGEFTNQGVEMSLTATPIVLHNGFQWVTTTTFFRNYSVVNSLPVPAFDLENGGGGSLGTFRIQVGRSVSQVVGQFNGPDGQPIQAGDAQPSYVMNFNNEFTFHRFHAAALVVWSRGGAVGNFTDNLFDVSQGLLADSALSAKRNAENNANGTPYLETATFVKVREMSLSYSLPDKFVAWLGNAVHVKDARLSVTGRDLFAWFAYTGLDPEVNFVGQTQIQRGQDVTPFPPARSVFVSLDLGI
jgi:TonB-dependent starch-binding outer membrane protein SusC